MRGLPLDLLLWDWQVSAVLDGTRAKRLYSALLTAVHTLPGDVAEFGVYQGETARELCRYLEAHGLPQTVHLFDTFAGLPPATPEDQNDHVDSNTPGLYRCGLDTVYTTLRACTQYRLYHGLFAKSLPDFGTPLCLAHVDADLYAGTRDALACCQRLLVPGGIVVIDDYRTHWAGVTQAVDEALQPCCWDLNRFDGQARAVRRLKCREKQHTG